MSYVRIDPWGLTTVQVDTLTDKNASVAAATIHDDTAPEWRSTYTVTASAKREPGDPYNESVGQQLAIGRALEKLGKDLQRAAWSRTSK